MSDIDRLVDEVAGLAPLPAAYVRIRELIAEPNSCLSDIADVIKNDPALTTRILRIANSAYLGLIGTIDSIPRAVQILGTQAVHDLALATSAMSSLNALVPPAFDMYRFWRRSIYCAVVAQILAEDTRIQGPQRLFVCGLLHDIGHLILAVRRPEQYTAAMTRSIASGQSLHVVEHELYGFDYAELGAALLQHWLLPAGIHTPIAHHPDPTINRAIEHAKSTAVLHIAAVISRASVWRDASDEPVPDFNSQAFSMTQLDDQKTEAVMQKADIKVVDAMELLLPAAVRKRHLPPRNAAMTHA